MSKFQPEEVLESVREVKDFLQEMRDQKLVEEGAIQFGQYLIVPEMVIQSERSVYVRWCDGSVNSATAAVDDTFDPEIGYAMCLLKHAYRGKDGKHALAKILDTRRYQEKKPRKPKKVKKGGKKK